MRCMRSIWESTSAREISGPHAPSFSLRIILAHVQIVAGFILAPAVNEFNAEGTFLKLNSARTLASSSAQPSGTSRPTVHRALCPA